MRSKRFILAASVGLLLAVVGLPEPAAAQDAVPESDPTLPVAGVPYRLTIPAGVDTVRVTYRPGSNVEIHEVLHASDDGVLSWTPLRAGVVRVATAESMETLSVRFDRTPVPGVLVMLVAGLILFGGIVYALRMLLESDKVPSDLPSDT